MMKKNLRNLSLAALSIVLFTQCSKDASSPVANYSPLTAGSNWTYKYTEGNASSTFKLTATNRDTVANGKTYKVLTSSEGTSTYLSKVGNDYYRFAALPTIGVFEELYLMDNKAVNETWTGTTTFKYGTSDVTANRTYTIKGKGESRTVNGKSFSNVTHVRLDISVFGFAVGGGDFYYQEGVGLIDDTISVTPPAILGGQPYNSSQGIVSYEIK